MSNLEILALDTAVPQIRAPGAGDGYVANRPVSIFGATLGQVLADSVTLTLRRFSGTQTSNILSLQTEANAALASFDKDGKLTTPTVNLGVAGTTLGTLTLSGNTSGTVTIQPAAAAGTYSLTLPTDDGNAGQYLKTDGSGVLSWDTLAATPAGSDTQVQFNNSGSFGGSSLFTWNGTSVAIPSLSLAGNISAAAWTTNGIGVKVTTRTLTDTSSSGTVAAAYTNVLGGNTIAATNSTTYTNYASLYLGEPVAGSNVTLTNKWSLITAGSIWSPGLSLGTAGSTLGVLKLSGNTSGTVTINTKAAAGTYTLTLPDNDGDSGQLLKTDGSGVTSWASDVASIGYVIDGGGIAITTGTLPAAVRVPYNCTIDSVTLIADQTGSIVVDIWKDTFANFPPTVADSICASAKPTLSSARTSENTTLTGWTKTVTAGDVFLFNVDSATTVQTVTVILKVTKT